METMADIRNGRYLLFLDLLGFSELVEQRDVEEVYATIEHALQAFSRWEKLNGLFRTLYFSDTFVFYQEPKGYGKWAFLDIYGIGAMVLSALLAKGIPARGVISFGGFNVRHDQSYRHHVYFGRALIEAHLAEKKESWVGISILPSAWRPYEAEEPGVVDAFERERVWLRRSDDVLLLNPFVKLKAWYQDDLLGEINTPYFQWDAPEFPNDILGFKFLRDQANAYANLGDFTSGPAIKYHTTLAFLQKVLGPDLYEWGARISKDSSESP